MENQHQAGVLQAPELRVDDTSADDDDRVPLADAARGLGCTVLDLLGLAAGGTIKLFVAMRPYDWVLTATLGAEPRRNASGSTGACQVEMLPKYAEELRNFGAATIRHIPVPGLPDMHFKALSVPQEVGIERVWIARGHVRPSSSEGVDGTSTDRHTAPKLSLAQQAEVRAGLQSGKSISALARQYGVHRNTIAKYKPASAISPLGTWPAAATSKRSR